MRGNNYEFIQICKNLLKENKVTFQKFSKNNNYSFFKKLDNDYLNNKNLIRNGSCI